MEYFAEGSPTDAIDATQAAALLERMLTGLGRLRRVLLVPPDFSRFASGAGELTALLYERLKERAEVEVLPALGTHVAMTTTEIERMFPGVPAAAFRAHEWRGELARLGDVPAEFVRWLTGGRLEFPIACEVNRRLIEGRWDRIVSIGQVVPHEVAGIAGHSKNIFIGLGGADVIHKTHFIGAVCGMEQAMGRADAPVRQVLEYIAREFGRELPISYVLTVRAQTASGEIVTRGLFAGDDEACFQRAAALSQQVNITWLDEPVRKMVVYLDPAEYKSTWLGNKAIYRTRMALATGGELVILAPGVQRFGEDPGLDALIRKYGYRGTARTLEMVENNVDLAANLAVAAHLIHGSSEGRFRITYCPGGLSREEIESVGYQWGDLQAAANRYPRPAHDGWTNAAVGERVYGIRNPGIGLWARRVS